MASQNTMSVGQEHRMLEKETKWTDSDKKTR